MLAKLKSTISNHKSKAQPLLTLGLAVLIFTFVVFPETALAVSGNDILNTTYAKIVSLFKIVLDFLSLLLWPVILIIGGLIQNDIIFGGGMEDRLRQIWVEVRNIVNIFFVLGLLGIAFYNVLGVGDDKIKQFLPKLIIGIIAVNFTFLASKVVLDAANVLTVSLFSIPQSIDPEMANVIPDKEDIRAKFETGICTSLYNPENGADETYIQEILQNQAQKAAVASKKTGTALTNEATRLANSYQNAPSGGGKSEYQKLKDSLICDGLKLNFNKINITSSQANNKNLSEEQKTEQNRQFFFKLFDKYDANNAALAMAINLQNVYKIRHVQIAGKFDKLALNVIFSVVLYIIYASAYVALFAVLVVRILVVWICIIFSPIIIFSSKLGGPSIPGISENADKLIDNFVKHVQAPIIIAGTMTIGYIMLRSFQGGVGTGVSLFDTKTSTLGLPTSGLDTFKELLIAVATCAIVWMGVFAAANETLAKGFTEGLQSAVGGLGKFILKSPQYLPLIPIKRVGEKGKAEPVPLASVLRGFSSLPTELENRAQVYEKSQQFVKSILGDPFDKKIGQGGNLAEEKKLIARNKTGVRAGQIDYKLWISSPHIQGMLKKLSTFQQNAINEAIRKGEEISATGTNKAAYAAWQEFIKQNKINIETPAPESGTTGTTGTTGTNAAAATNTASAQLRSQIQLLGKPNSKESTTVKAGLEQKEQAALEALRKATAAKDNTAYANAVQAAGGEGEVEKLRAKVRALYNTSAANLTQDLGSDVVAKREAAIKRIAEELKRAKLQTPQIKAVIKKRLTDANVQPAEAETLATNATSTTT